MALYLIGIGLHDEKDITLKGLELVKASDVVYLESYTSILAVSKEALEKTYGKKEDILLCFGNWSQTQQMKYTMPTKGVGLRRIISKKFNVVLIDEFKTSKLCSCCHCELENYKLRWQINNIQ